MLILKLNSYYKGEIDCEKNKIDVVKAVCSSAAKRLVSLFLISAIGGLAFVGDKGKFWVSAQDQIELDHLLAEVLQLNERIQRFGDFDGEEEFEEYRVLLDQVRHIIRSRDIPLEEAERIVNEDMLPLVDRLENARQRQVQNQERRGGFLSLLNPLNWLNALGRGFGNLVGSLENWFVNLIHPQQPNAPRVARDNALDGIQRGNHITAGANSHVHSFSANELTHEGEGLASITGLGPVNIDYGEITISECNDDLSRNVTVNSAGSLTVAPNVNVNLRNGTAFETGKTAQETLRNLLRAMNPQEVAQVMKETLGQK